MRVYFIRHGQSEGNISTRHHSWEQVSLTEQGKKDAAMAGRLIKGIHFDKVYASDLIRTTQTQQIALPDAQPEVLPLLREVNVGCLLGKEVSDCIAQYGDKYLQDRKRSDYTDYGGESKEMLRNRIRQFLTMLEQTDYEKVAVFGHATYLFNLARMLTNAPDKDWNLAYCDNGSVAVIEYKNDRWTLVSWNITELNRE